MEEANNRTQVADQLVEDFNLKTDAEYFSDPTTRLEFLRTLDFDDFRSITQHINARVRGFEPRENQNADDQGSYLPMLRTPSAAEKPIALQKGFETIQKYLEESTDTDEHKVRSVAMATEALIIWTHPFNDGNGRTSRFLGKFIEDGTVDTDDLISATTDRNERMRMYPEYLRVDDTTDLNNEDIILEDDEIEQIRQAQDKLPIIEGISLSLSRLMQDKSLQERVLNEESRNRQVREAAMARGSTKAA